MAKLVWDAQGKKLYETGARMAVLYRINESGEYKPGVAWNGLTGVDENPSGADATSLYADDSKYIDLIAAEEYSATIKAYTYPDEFEECDGSVELAPGVMVNQQTRKPFGFCYRSVLGNDTAGEDYGYKLHLVYGLKASPSTKSRTTINDSPSAIEFSWEAKSTPVSVSGGLKPVSSLVITSTNCDPTELKALEDILYGTENQEPRMPLPDEVKTLITKRPSDDTI